jgi:hypothetical protein
MHACFFGRPPSLLVVARETAGHDVAPAFVSFPDDGNDMIEGEILRRALLPAILAGVVVPGVNIGPAELNVMETLPRFYIFEQSKHAGQFHSETDAADFFVIFRQNFNLALEKESQGALPRNNVDRFEGGV